MNAITALGGRRFLLALGTGIVCSILVWFGKISDQVFAAVVVATVAAYITGNTIQKVKRTAE
ncbi:hypothetical protein PQR63_23060 [Herbaspirillum rhizosphaerae]|uniref:Uncharacterized protein n=1 Tax=Herbaspirillum rhizosphaerae TaxID=346179 RepID=A0ABW8ZGL1_9BURK